MKRDDNLWKAILEDVFDDFLTFSTRIQVNYLILTKDLNTSTKSWSSFFHRRKIFMHCVL
ncbi:hypothetical protein [Dyadobacter luteus]|jgi:hypothetical protein|uniref:hypothetical protein n=1 Tax=Dyadobacter luteus TaxID=2259619 RepID=UPI001E5DE180|nr:hypothetical protein [Dyadobacter luteus]